MASPEPRGNGAIEKAIHCRVNAVVLTWNDVDMARRCVASVLAGSCLPQHVVVVDNGSDFPTLEPLRVDFPELVTVQLPENMGFTAGCNRGIEQAIALGADYVLLLNNDTIVHTAALERLVEAMEAEPMAGMASAVLLDPGEEKRIQFFQVRPFPNKAFGQHSFVGQPLSEDLRKTVETGFAPACAVLFRVSALREVGLFDETLFTNWEDYDLCMRLRRAGYRLLTVGTAEVIHAHGQTTGRVSPFITYFSVRNRLICLFRYGSWPGILWNAPFLLRSLYRQMRRYGWGNLACHRAFALGLWHFLTGVRGKGGAPKNRSDKGRESVARV